MIVQRLARVTLAAGLLAALAACGGGLGSGNLFGNRASIPTEDQMTRKERADEQRARLAAASGEDKPRSTLWDLF